MKQPLASAGTGTALAMAYCSCLLLALLAPVVNALPTNGVANVTSRGHAKYLDFYEPGSDLGHAAHLQGREDKPFYLRIMPLGASITKGEPAPPDDTERNGYRKPIRDRLRQDGWFVNMVGSVGDWGTMMDRENEGWPGLRVSEVHGKAKASVPSLKPNLFLINAGTNDATQNREDDSPATAHLRMRAMMLDLIAMVPEATLILSTLLPYTGSAAGAVDRCRMINDNYRRMGNELIASGYKVLLADMDDGFITGGDIFDGTHPTLEGRRKMAAVWYEAFQRAEKAGMLSKPSDDVNFVDGSENFQCEKKFGSGNTSGRAGWQVLAAADPLISNDGPYRHGSEARGTLVTSNMMIEDQTWFWFAQLVNQGADRGGEWDDLVEAKMETEDRGQSYKKRTLTMRMNTGGGTFGDPVTLNIGDGCIPRGIRWGDVNNDGLDDFICIGVDGSMFVSVNVGGNPPKFEWRGQARGPTNGYEQKHVRLGDIDGDGRLDYCLIGDDGNIRCWRNGGLGDLPAYWQDMSPGQPIFLAKGMGDIRGVRFVDINGDFRADWIWIDETGKTVIYINQRGSDKSMTPSWVQAASSHGGGFDLVDSGSRKFIQFGRVFGSGRADYAWIQKGDCDDKAPGLKKCDWKINVWENKGGGGRFQKGDGAYWGDMRGRGVDDYIWISPSGVVNVFPNQNTKEDTTRDATRGIWGGSIRALETSFDRRALHIGDWDGDGRDDVIAVDKWSGALTVWFSGWSGGTDFKFRKESIAGSANTCRAGWGVGYFDNGHHFADITGEGRVDYLCMEPSGRVTGWLNDGSSTLRSVGQVKFSEDLDRANFRFADVNGDGKADLIWTDKFIGDAEVWQNDRELAEDERMSGSKFHWMPKGKLYLGSSRGPNLHFPNLGGQGRADMVQVDPTTAHGWAWYNMCPASSGNGGPLDDAVMNGNLPAYTPAAPGNPGTPGGEEDDKAICGGTVAKLDKELWQDLGMGDWLDLRLRYYANSQDGWPNVGTEGGVPRVIAEYDLRNHDEMLNWPGQCQAIESTCTLADSDYRDNCIGRARRSFAVFAMSRYSRFLQLHYNSLTDEALIQGLAVAKMTTVFINPYQGSDVEMNNAGWLTMAAGFATTLGAIAGPAGVFLGSIVGGSLTVAAGFAGSASLPEMDPKFTSYADLSDNFSRAITKARDNFEKQYDSIITKMPPKGDLAAGTKLSRVLASGDFANQDIGTGETAIDSKFQRRMIRASLIASMWNSQKLFIAKFPTGGLNYYTTSGFRNWNPCFGENRTESDMHKHVHCFDDAAWVILEQPQGFGTQYMWRKFGQDHDTLKNDYDLEPSELIHAAERVQRLTRTFKSTDMNALSDYFTDLANDPSGNIRREDLLHFNVPVCYLEGLDTSGYHPACGTRVDQCPYYAIAHYCQQMYLSDTVSWPYYNNF
ncbi:related to acetylxylan esterase [Cephalotrichum gorgonifer]|uniref:Related to acetylxylan esterase n=1 Tax=Cephalotrichum gorgonifer TaxID=2041049 RepID=A0AAE8MW62_9PEZI|nr:related to acetylxylan esterase [Cephalotrichum gorgonifer]